MKKIFYAFSALLLVAATSCSNNDDGPINSNLTLNLSGLEALGDDYVYEGWIIVNGAPVSTGIFSDVSSAQVFSVDTEVVE